jgi:hypothetical protein
MKGILFIDDPWLPTAPALLMLIKLRVLYKLFSPLSPWLLPCMGPVVRMYTVRLYMPSHNTEAKATPVFFFFFLSGGIYTRC